MIEQVVEDALDSIDFQKHSDSCIWVGLSAGVDSTALLHAVAQCCSASGQKLGAIHVHHGLSEHADAWARQAQMLCEELSEKFSITIDVVVDRVQLGSYDNGLEQAARSARYRIFSKHCGPNDVLLQGHHLDDQFETFFMRAIRGSGLTGLASIPKTRSLSRHNSCQILRPFLDTEKNELIEYAKKHQLSWVEDESNQDSKIDRNWWRNELLPQIWQRYPEHKHSLSRTITNIQHEQSLLQRLLQNLLQGSDQQLANINIHPALMDIPRFDLSLIQDLDQATCVSYLRAWLAQHVDNLPSVMQMDTIYSDLIFARVDREPQVSWSLSSLHRYQNCLYLLRSDMRNDDSNVSDDEGVIEWQGGELNCFQGLLVCSALDANFALTPAQYGVRNWQAGDVAKPSGRSTRKMKKWWQDYNVPSWMREHWPIIVNKETNEIAAVPGLFVCQGYCVDQGETGWLVEYKMILT